MSKVFDRTARRVHVRDFVAYIFISFAVVAAIVVAALEGVSESRFMKWYCMVLFTAAVFGQFLLKSKDLWKKKPFWIVYAAGFTIHLLLCAWLFHLGGLISGIQWLLLALGEIFILVILRNLMFGPKPTRPNTRIDSPR
jgi:hypothetical protein